ncbi:MAG: D-aminoacylase [Candidatus Sungbacteria bacterium]|uniref:D-aminoacylase n=1 Tax=Candidatus Sungiibacteriota bacterium TaxID=2750080 RepID=A0A9D6LSM2_9BACT|nr:D-aminoacylase [Candidatus Sungbacteria bacterium]
MFDILIKNGTVIDGTGKPGFLGDVGIKDGLIEAVGQIGGGEGKKIIAGEGLYVTPGFIDVTNHSDVTASIFERGRLDSLIRQGITTIIGGNCGVSLAPLIEADLIHAIRKFAPTSSINVNWQSVAEFLSEIEKLHLPINFATLAGHNTIRRGILHERGDPMTLEELAETRLLLQQALRDGALGFSTNLSSAHEHYVLTDELVEICRVMAAEGGVYKTHLRDEGSDLIVSINEALRIGAEAGVPVSISHLKAIGRKSWPLMKQGIHMIENNAREGHKVVFDVSPYASTGSQLYMLLPAWAKAGGFAAMLERLKDFQTKSKIIAELDGMSLHFDLLRVAEAGDGVSSGSTIAELGRRMGLDAKEAMIELLIANRGRISIVGKTLHHKNIELGIISPYSMVASNGSGYSFESAKSRPHPRSFGAFPHFLHSYVKDKKLISWEEAIAKITSLPASFLGIKNRGRIEKRYAADIVLFRPDELRDQATYKNPYRAPVGIEQVMVNGRIVFEHSAVTAESPGEIIKKA